MDWYVSYHLPIAKDCKGRVVETAGGPGVTVGDCCGAGYVFAVTCGIGLRWALDNI